MAETTDAVTYQSNDGVAQITINRPDKMNAINAEVEIGLADAWRRFNTSNQDKVAVLTGAGDRAFSAGRDRLSTAPPDYRRFAPNVVIAVDKPVIAAVSGWCIGGALTLVQMCDLCIAAENTRFSYPEAKIGFAGGLVASLVGRIPHKVAMEVMLLGEELSVERAYQVGFVNKIVPDGQHLNEALMMAHQIASRAPLVLGMLKRFANDVLPKGPVEKGAFAFGETERVFTSLDFSEGLLASQEKRPPRFTGQ